MLGNWPAGGWRAGPGGYGEAGWGAGRAEGPLQSVATQMYGQTWASGPWQPRGCEAPDLGRLRAGGAGT